MSTVVYVWVPKNPSPSSLQAIATSVASGLGLDRSSVSAAVLRAYLSTIYRLTAAPPKQLLRTTAEAAAIATALAQASSEPAPSETAARRHHLRRSLIATASPPPNATAPSPSPSPTVAPSPPPPLPPVVACVSCSGTTQAALGAALCFALPVTSCRDLTVTCLDPGSAVTAAYAYPVLSAAASNAAAAADGCSPAFLKADIAFNGTDQQIVLLQSILTTQTSVPGLGVVQPPVSGSELSVSALLGVTVVNNRSSAGFNSLIFGGEEVAKRVADVLGVPLSKVIVSATLPGGGNSSTGGGGSSLPEAGVQPSAPAPSPENCDEPHFGSLCGASALGAIIGTVVGGVLVLTALILFGYVSISRGSRRVVPLTGPSNTPGVELDEAQHLSYRGPPYGNMPHVQEMLPPQQFVVAPNGQVMVGQAPLFASPYALDVSGMYGMPPGSAVLRPATALTSSLAPVAYSPATASAARQQLAMQQQAAMLGAPLMYGSPQPAQPMVLNLTLTPPERWRRHQQRAASPSTWDDAALMGGGSGSGRNVWNGAAGGTVDPEPWLPAHMRTPPPAPRPPLRMPVALTLQPNTSPAAAVVESASSPQQREGQQGLGQGQGQLGAQGSSLKGLRSQWSAWAGHESPDQRRRSACRYPGDGSSAGGAVEPCSPTRHGPGVGGIASVSGGAPPLRPPRLGVRAGAGLGAVALPLPPFVGARGPGVGAVGLPQGVAQGSGLDLRALGLGAPRYAPGLQLLPGAAGRGSAGGRSMVGAGSVDT
ncbi:hypothetical protein HYH03_005787 [Edaphochlamys debaryana]|uniref:Uncharacterized protein n=1 Tax=Edaphochlamys debaryana TaxID=47281 RepID=A0A835Y4B6_9CHLO|nr:hypothetical protein HYH03_005787 [Edaphochlamys debaryana]|eukprot:KAG2496187.1 hypothetical protein HYH03_005787 [Edaphochlamys debaryana]